MKLAVVGNPIEHSKSPHIFQFLSDIYQLKVNYEKLLLNRVDEIPALFELGFEGVNITAPFKQDVLPFLDQFSDEVIAIGSANTIVLKDGKLKGYNTDYIGVLHALEENGNDLSEKKCLVLGAGGAARAAVYGLKKRNTKIQVYNRSEYKAKHLSDEFDVNFLSDDDLQNAVSKADILIDTLPAGIQLVKSEWLHESLTILDASYPKSIYTDLAKANLIGGEYWLLHQALPAFELFTGIKLNKKNYNQQELIDLLIKS